MGERLARLWPSLVALFGTVAVVLALLWWFGDDVDDSTPEAAAGSEDVGGEAADSSDPGETGGEAPTEAPTESGADGEEPSAEPEPTETAPPTVSPELREEIGVLNQTTVDGLAGQVQQRLEDGGWEVPAIGPFDGGNVPETTVYYPEGMQEAAEALSAQFPEIGRIRPNVEPFNDTRLVVVLVEDYVDEVGTQQ